MNGTGLFRELDPPPGGAARLRGALAAAEKPASPIPTTGFRVISRAA